jgi:topoisomerase-4 subunit A
VDTLVVLGSNGRAYSVAVAGLPGGRGDGVPVTTLVDLEAGTQPAHYFAGASDARLLLAGSGGLGLLARAGDLHGRNRGGKAFLSLEAGEQVLPPSIVHPAHHQVACLALDGRLLCFGIDELKLQPNGGRGLTLMGLDAKSPLVAVATCSAGLRLIGKGRGGRLKEEVLGRVALQPFIGKRARKGHKVAGWTQVSQLRSVDA